MGKVLHVPGFADLRERSSRKRCMSLAMEGGRRADR
jgi:hypothetical protein